MYLISGGNGVYWDKMIESVRKDVDKMGFKTDIEIAQEAEMKVINEIADSLGIPDQYVENYGKYKAKIDYRYYNEVLRWCW